jgi:pyruvate/2-oxoglutarate dehydrogenase complex dihydrolipoamide dehydrogenase (E3) component
MSLPPLTDSPHDRELVAHVHPAGWVNPAPARKYHLVVIGAGTAGLVTAAAAAGLGARVALVERGLMGGDCLNVGCVPSKAILASARAAADVARAAAFGIAVPGPVAVDFPAVMERMRGLRAAIAPHDSARRFRDLGVDVFLGAARFRSRAEIEVGDARLRFARAVIATGGRSAVPPIPGLVEAGFRTNETIFDLIERPRRLAVLGGGPIGCELAQAFARLGAQVTILQRQPQLLPREDRDAAACLLAAFRSEGIDVRLEATIERVETNGRERILQLARDGERVVADEILVAAGRQPNVEELGLAAAGVRFGPKGVEVDDFLRTTNRRIYAAGDVALPHRFTHVADAAARIVVQNALFPFGRKLSALVVPWSTYTDPEIAHVGCSEGEAKRRGLRVETVTVPFADVDRARLEGATAGFVRIHAESGSGRIVGATIVGRDAGDLVSEISVAMAGKLSLGALGSVIHPYPTRAEAIRKAGDAWNRRRLTPFAKRLLRDFLSLRFGGAASAPSSAGDDRSAGRGSAP